MKRLINSFLAASFSAGLAILGVAGFSPANAQVNIQLGGDFGQAKRALIQRGYTQIRLVGQGFTKFQVEACLKGVRYWFKTDSRGRINQNRKIGQCQRNVSIERAQEILASHGYTRINMEDRAGTYMAIACFGNDRVRVAINHLGQLGARRVLGSCREAMSPSDVSAALRREGYTRIKFIQRQLPVYLADACLGKRKFRLELDQFARTLSEKRIGDCRGPIDQRRLVQFLENQGYSQVVIIDDQLPRYVAEVCKARNRLELTLNRYGDIIDRYKSGSCATRIDRRQIVQRLRDQGGSRINVVREDSRGYLIEACLEGEVIRFEINPFGELINERNLGQCKRFSIKQVKNRLAKRDFDDLEFYVQGCKNRKLIRFKVNEYGDRSERQVLGRCK